MVKMKNTLLVAGLLFVFGMAIENCQSDQLVIRVPDDPYQKLSEYNFFKGIMSDLDPSEGVLPYDLNSPLFSDYAYKARFVWMPEGTSANYTTEQSLDFPDKTVLIKNFYYLNDERDPLKGKKIIETRLLINQAGKWDALTYIWN